MKLSRVASITKVFLDEGLGFLTEKRPQDDSEDADAGSRPSNRELGKRLRRTLERLGPTFVKFGQMLGTRVDLLSEEVIEELSQLHSQVPPFPNEQARQILQAELGSDLDEVFEELSEDPIAAASIAQVYEGRLKDGERVAVKVQRPGLEESLLADLEALVEISGWLDTLVPTYRRSMVHKVAQEYAHRARQELDFIAEANATEEFDEVLTTLPELRAPKVFRKLCTPRVLVIEWFEGVKLDTVKAPTQLAELGFDPDTFSRTMLRLQLSMSYEHGFVHGDTHPGNIILLPSGHVGLIDFGLNARVPRALRDKMLETLFYTASGRTDEAVSAFIDVLSPDPSIDRAALGKELGSVLAASVRAESESDDEGTTAALLDALRVASRYRLEAPSELFMVVRNLSIVEGIVARYSPDLDLIAELKEITGAILRRKMFGPSMVDEMTQLLPQIALNVSKRPQLVDRLLRLERSFVDSRSLGDFLRKEDVLAPKAPKADSSALMVVLALVAGIALGFAGHLLLG